MLVVLVVAPQLHLNQRTHVLHQLKNEELLPGKGVRVTKVKVAISLKLMMKVSRKKKPLREVNKKGKAKDNKPKRQHKEKQTKRRRKGLSLRGSKGILKAYVFDILYSKLYTK